jgi:DNA-binding transcriptional MerR regulator
MWLLRVSPATLRYWKYRGVGPRSWKAGRHTLYDAEDVEQWIDEQRAKSVPAR